MKLLEAERMVVVFLLPLEYGTYTTSPLQADISLETKRHRKRIERHREGEMSATLLHSP